MTSSMYGLLSKAPYGVYAVDMSQTLGLAHYPAFVSEMACAGFLVTDSVTSLGERTKKRRSECYSGWQRKDRRSLLAVGGQGWFSRKKSVQVELEQTYPRLGTIYSLCSVYYPNIR